MTVTVTRLERVLWTLIGATFFVGMLCCEVVDGLDWAFNAPFLGCHATKSGSLKCD